MRRGGGVFARQGRRSGPAGRPRARCVYTVSMSPHTLYVIRHAEKPDQPAPVRGVDEQGHKDGDSLTVRGWQRAGALAVLFGDPAMREQRGLEPPAQLYACAVGAGHASKRSEQTLAPLAQRLGLSVRTGFTKGDEAALAEALCMLEDTALVCWSHTVLPGLLRAIAPHADLPAAWPDERFDLVFRFTRKRGEAPRQWKVRQIGQLLLAGDSDTPI